MQIKEASYVEIEIVKQIMHDSFREYTGVLNPHSGALRETVEDIRTKIEGRGGAIIVWDNAEPLGTSLYYFENDYMYIGRVSVLPTHRGRGIGRLMMTYLEELARKKCCSKTRIEVRMSLPENIHYYKNMNYMPIEEHEYPDKTDRWYIMEKELLFSL